MTIYAKRVDGGEVLPERGDLEIESTMSWSVSVMDDDPTQPCAVRGTGRIPPARVVGRNRAAMDLSTDGSFFDLAVELSASHDRREIWKRRWQERIPANGLKLDVTVNVTRHPSNVDGRGNASGLPPQASNFKLKPLVTPAIFGQEAGRQLPRPVSNMGGSSRRQRSNTIGQQGWNLQPLGILPGPGSRPGE